MSIPRITLIIGALLLYTVAKSNPDSHGKWLPEKSTTVSSAAPKVDDFLKVLNAKMRILYCKYQEENLIMKYAPQANRLKLDTEEWETNIEINHVPADKSALDIILRFRLISGTANASGVAVAFDFSDWSTGNYVLLPASVYNGNRCEIVNRGYNEGLERKFLYQKDIPLMSVPIPSLSNRTNVESKLEVNSSYMSTPAICIFDIKTKHGFIVLTEQGTQFGDNGFSIEESMDRTIASFVISAPGVKDKKPEFVGFSKSADRGANLKAGEEIYLRMRVYSFPAKDIPTLLEKFMNVRKAVTGKNQPRNLIPFSQVEKFMTERIDDRWYDGPGFQFYCPENANWISFGWVGGLINTYPMLALGDTMHLKRVEKTFDFAIPRAQGKSGYFYGAINYDGEVFGRESYNDFQEIVLTRKNADVLFWMIKQFELLKIQGREKHISPEWERNIKRVADAFVSTWKKNGQWGRMLNCQTGEVAEYNTSGGVMAIAGLSLASVYYNQPEYLIIAKEAARFYYQRDFVKEGMTTGACADIMQNADSETAAGFMTALMALFEITGDRQWLQKSQDLANLFATWTTSYDYQLPKETELGRLGAKLAGIVWASTQNKHGAPGICTSSGDPLFKIYRATGNQLYADLIHDIAHAHAESIRPGGFTNERLTYCEADSRGELGTHSTGWNELNGFLMALEIPGIYLQTDSGKLYVFDHIKAEILKSDDNCIQIKITNPTPFDAIVSVFAETQKQAKKPLGYNAFLNWTKIGIKSGESGDFLITNNKGITVTKLQN